MTCWYECPNCRAVYPTGESIYQCTKCAVPDGRRNLLVVRHDIEALRSMNTPEKWRSLFEARTMTTDYPFGSGVWGKMEWVLPSINQENIVSCMEGWTNLFQARRLGKQIGLTDLWVKTAGQSHTGSFKDLGMTVLVSNVMQMISDGKPIRYVACASTGDTSAALAAYCAMAGIPVVVLLPEGKVTPTQLIQPTANGALTFLIDRDFDGCMQMVGELCRSDEVYLANSKNPLRLEGQKTIAVEMVQQFDWEPIDWVIVPVGNCGNITAIGQGFLMMKQLGLIDRIPRLVGAQAERANPLADLYRRGYPDEPFVGMRAQTTQANAIQIGNPINIYKAIDTLKQMPEHFVLDVSEDEIADACARADRTGLFTCPHTGVALGALFKLVGQGKIGPNDRVVVVSTASGLKFTESKVAYHSENDKLLPGITPLRKNQHIQVAANLDAIRRLMDERYDDIRASAQ